jgi:hypothetical protein
MMKKLYDNQMNVHRLAASKHFSVLSDAFLNWGKIALHLLTAEEATIIV